MKILQIAHGIYPYANAGVEIYTYNLTKELLYRGHDVRIAAHLDDGRKIESIVDSSLRPLPWAAGHRWGDDLSRRNRKLLRDALAKIIRDFDPEIIHVQHLINIGWETLVDLQNYGIPFIVSLPDYWYLCRGIQRRCQGSLLVCTRNCSHISILRPHQFAYEYFRSRQRLKHCIELLNRIAAPLVSISHRTAEIYKGAGIESDRIVVQPWGIDQSVLKNIAEETNENPIRYGYIGSVYRHKGVDVLIRAFLKLKNGSVLHVFGDGDPAYIQELQDLASGAPVYFYGAYDHSDITRILSKFDIAVIPSIWEEVYGLVVQEALAAKKIVIASAVGGIKDRIFHGVNGFLVPSGDHEMLASEMSYVAENYHEVYESIQFDAVCQDIAVDGGRFEDLYNWTKRNWTDICRGEVLPVEWELNIVADSLSKYLVEDKTSIHQKLKKEHHDPGSSVRDAWTSAKPESDVDITEFYRRTDSYLYDLLLVHRTPERRRWREVASSLLVKYKVSRLLDYGGGCGDDSLHFSRLGVSCTLFDISPRNADYAKFRADELNVNLEVLNQLPDDRKFDAIYCTELLEHVPCPLDEIKTMHSLLLPEGVAILTHSFDLIGEDYPSHLERHRGLSNRFVSDVERLGFEFQETIIVPGNRFLVFKKQPDKRTEQREIGDFQASKFE